MQKGKLVLSRGVKQNSRRTSNSIEENNAYLCFKKRGSCRRRSRKWTCMKVLSIAPSAQSHQGAPLEGTSTRGARDSRRNSRPVARDRGAVGQPAFGKSEIAPWGRKGSHGQLSSCRRFWQLEYDARPRAWPEAARERRLIIY
jgi:hypothetical protein